MFDLPTETSVDKLRYRWFRKYLINDGFMMMQESVYSKICLNLNAANVISQNVRKNRPPSGLVQLMVVTERQFARMEYIVGEENKIYVQSDERLIIL
jgi:CRISPR-associated protein Cas2